MMVGPKILVANLSTPYLVKAPNAPPKATIIQLKLLIPPIPRFDVSECG